MGCSLMNFSENRKENVSGLVAKEIIRHKTDPVPRLFKIIEAHCIKGHLWALINYPNCTTHRGDKILVWAYRDITWLNAQMEIDPHFLDTSNSPSARFPANALGIRRSFLFIEKVLGQE